MTPASHAAPAQTPALPSGFAGPAFAAGDVGAPFCGGSDRWPARMRDPDTAVRPIASALLTAGAWALRRPHRRLLGGALLAASLILVARQRARTVGT